MAEKRSVMASGTAAVKDPAKGDNKDKVKMDKMDKEKCSKEGVNKLRSLESVANRVFVTKGKKTDKKGRIGPVWPIWSSKVQYIKYKTEARIVANTNNVNK